MPFAIIITPQAKKWTEAVVPTKEEAENWKDGIESNFRNLKVEIEETGE